MPSRPRRSAATKASQFISVHAKWADNDRGEPAEGTRRSGRVADDASSKMPSTKPRPAARGATRRGESFEGGDIVSGKRDRGGKKRYVVDSSPEDDDDEEDELELDDEDDEMEDLEDAEGEEMDLDAEGEDIDAEGEDADGGEIRVAVAPETRGPQRAARVVEDDDDDDLSDPEDSDGQDQTLNMADDTMNMDDEDAEGEEILDEDAEGEDLDPVGDEGLELDSEDGSRAGTPDLAKMTVRQRARFKDEPHEFMKLSDEVQAKKHFTAEELSMRRQEMARRRRNLSEKRNEEVKMETINKLLKKQAPKINKKAAAAAIADAAAESAGEKASAVFVRWVSSKEGSRVAVPEEIMDAPAGKVFGPPGPRKMVEEVA